jgi:hypothetical protein
MPVVAAPQFTLEDSETQSDLCRIAEPFFTTKQARLGMASRAAGQLCNRTADGYGPRTAPTVAPCFQCVLPAAQAAQ